MPLSHERALPLALGAVAFLLYAATLAPGLSGGDAGELTLAAHRFAVAHPPGYPLFVLLGHLASWVPFGSGSFRLNLFCALCGAGAAALLTAAVLRLTRSAPAALCSAALFCFAPLTWSWSTRTDVFALANLLAAALIWSAARHAAAPSPRTLAMGGLFTGLALSNHHTGILLAAPLAVWAVWRIRGEPWRRLAWFGAAAGLLAGLLPYLLLPLAARLSPVHSWGEATTLSGFWELVTRADYGTLQLAARTRADHLPQALSAFAAACVRATLGVGLLGAAMALRTRRPLSIPLAVALLLCGPVFLALARFPLPDALHAQTLARFFLLPTLVLCVLAGLGLPALLRRARWQWGLALAFGVTQIGWTLATQQHPVLSVAEVWARETLAPLPERSVLLMRGDLLSNALRWAQEGEGLRPDVALMDLELLTRPWHARTRGASLQLPAARYFPGAADGFSLSQLVAANPGRAFYLVGELKPGDPSNAQFRLRPDGLAQRLLPAGDVSVAPAFTLAPQLEAASRRQWEDAWDAAIVDECWEARHRPLLDALRRAISTQAQGSVYAEIAAGLEALISQHPAPPAAWLKNLGIAHARAGDLPRMRDAFRRYLVGAPDAADRALIQEQLR